MTDPDARSMATSGGKGTATVGYFDPEYLRALFDYGYAKGRAGYPWHEAPPVLEASTEQQKSPETNTAKTRK